MTWLAVALISWIVHAAVTVLAVRMVTPGNPANTLGRALLVTFLSAMLVGPLTGWLAILIVPLLIAAVVWVVIYMLAYGLGPLQAIGVGLLQTVLGWLVSVLVQMVLTSRT